MFSTVEVDVEGLAGVVAVALFDEVSEADEVDGVDGPACFFKFSDSCRDEVDCLTYPADSLRSPSVGFSGFA